MKRYDALVIDGGLNDLTSAYYLAKSGLSVLVSGKYRAAKVILSDEHLG
jgi:phytoene dehydrogenase-like protein